MNDLSEPGMFSHGETCMVAKIHPSFYYGMTVAELRVRGAKIPDNIPDCATYTERGTFEWIELVWKFEFEELKP